MENRYLEEDVRKRLILAGLEELCEHGIRDFSLRRVALSAQVSCAAPYRHFKDKDELIAAIVTDIFSKWDLLCRAIEMSHSTDPIAHAAELAVASIRFWLANGNFRTVLMLDGAQSPKFGELMQKFDRAFLSAVDKCLTGRDAESVSAKKLSLRALIYGTVLLLSTGRAENSPEAILSVKQRIVAELS